MLRVRTRVKKKKKKHILKAASRWRRNTRLGANDLREQMWNTRQGKIFSIFINDLDFNINYLYNLIHLI